MPLPSNLDEERAFFDYGEEDRRLLADLAPLLEKHADSLVASFYRHLLSFPDTRNLLRDPDVKDRLLVKQREYLLSLAGPTLDEAYIVGRRKIGEVHERIGLEPRWYLGAYALYVSMLMPLICEFVGEDLARGERTVVALNKLVLFDAEIAMGTYMDRSQRELEYLNQELSRTGRRLARDYEAQGAELRTTAKRAQAAERLASIGTLVAGLAHEIGTPMGVIQGHAKLLEPAVQGESAEWRLKTIQEQIARISKIIQSLLNMARPTRSTRTPVSLAPLLDNTLAFLTDKFQRRNVLVETSLESAPSVTGDPERLQQLFLNLFLNAADAMSEGGVLRVSLGPGDDGGAQVAVEDTGSGIPEEELSRIFDPFYTTKSAGEGNGLGLAVAHGIVSDHGGILEVTSTPGEGTQFQIVFPGMPQASEEVSPG